MTGFKVGIVKISNGFIAQGSEGPESWVYREKRADAITEVRVLVDDFSKQKED